MSNPVLSVELLEDGIFHLRFQKKETTEYCLDSLLQVRDNPGLQGIFTQKNLDLLKDTFGRVDLKLHKTPA